MEIGLHIEDINQNNIICIIKITVKIKNNSELHKSDNLKLSIPE